MKLLTLDWQPRIVTKGLGSAIASEHCTIGPYRACISSSENVDKYLKPYTMWLGCRPEGEKTTLHATIEEAKQTATQELSENIHKMCTELGYKLPE